MLEPGGSVLEFRGWLDHGARTAWEGRDLVVVAVDGLGAEAADPGLSPSWSQRVDTVFPTSSFPGWLSSLAGVSVEDHGVPGVVFRDPDDGSMVDLLRDVHQPSWSGPTVFSDARDRGDVVVAVLNDLRSWRNGTTERMLAGAQQRDGQMLFRRPSPVEPEAACRRLAEEVAEVRGAAGPRRSVVWLFVELDEHLHRRGHDATADAWLVALQHLAEDLVSRGCVVALHADHGLVPTVQVPELRADLEALAARHGTRLGGAGRTCWLHVRDPESVPDLLTATQGLFGDLADVISRDEVFEPGTPGWRAVGEVVVVARGEEFALPGEGSAWEHGSRTRAELDVPVMVWSR